MKIYKTEFDPETLQCTSGSVLTDFESLDQVVEVNGAPEAATAAWVRYNNTIFSKIIWHVEEEVSFL